MNIPESSSLGYYAKDIYLDIIIIVAFEEYKSISDCIQDDKKESERNTRPIDDVT